MGFAEDTQVAEFLLRVPAGIINSWKQKGEMLGQKDDIYRAESFEGWPERVQHSPAGLLCTQKHHSLLQRPE